MNQSDHSTFTPKALPACTLIQPLNSPNIPEFRPLTFNEEMECLDFTSVAYSKMGDHRRAIETEWKHLEKYSGDEYSSNHLKFIASEFGKLGETNWVQEIQKPAQ